MYFPKLKELCISEKREGSVLAGNKGTIELKNFSQEDY
jgi:hypothetical protein